MWSRPARLVKRNGPSDLRFGDDGFVSGRAEQVEILVAPFDRVVAKASSQEVAVARRIGRRAPHLAELFNVESDVGKPKQFVLIGEVVVDRELDDSQHTIGINFAQQRSAVAHIGHVEIS